MNSFLTLRVWIVFAVLWAAFVAYLAGSSWPRLPLDSGADVLTRQLLEKAIRDHVLVHLGLAVVPPLILLGVGRLMKGLGGLGS